MKNKNITSHLISNFRLDELGRLVITDNSLLKKINGAVGAGMIDPSANILDLDCPCNLACSHDESCPFNLLCHSDAFCNPNCPGHPNACINVFCP